MALTWYRRSAEQNFPDAQARLAEFYCTGGGGISKNPQKALSYFIKAAMQGCEPALTKLALPTQGWFPPVHVFFPPACHAASWATLLAARRFAVKLPEELWREHIFPVWRQENF